MMLITDKLIENETERLYLLAVLKSWEVAEQAGYKPHQIKAFTFRSEFLTDADRKQYPNYFRGKQIYSYNWINCIRLNTGQLIHIPLTPRPQREN